VGEHDDAVDVLVFLLEPYLGLQGTPVALETALETAIA
jgi:hypothetical protein